MRWAPHFIFPPSPNMSSETPVVEDPYAPARLPGLILRHIKSEPFLMLREVDVLEVCRLGPSFSTHFPALERTVLFQTLLAFRKSMATDLSTAAVLWDEFRSVDLAYSLLNAVIFHYQEAKLPDSAIGMAFSLTAPMAGTNILVFLNTAKPAMDNDAAFTMFMDQANRGNTMVQLADNGNSLERFVDTHAALFSADGACSPVSTADRREIVESGRIVFYSRGDVADKSWEELKTAPFGAKLTRFLGDTLSVSPEEPVLIDIARSILCVNGAVDSGREVRVWTVPGVGRAVKFGPPMFPTSFFVFEVTHPHFGESSEGGAGPRVSEADILAHLRKRV
jgi:hypothetical protein